MIQSQIGLNRSQCARGRIRIVISQTRQVLLRKKVHDGLAGRVDQRRRNDLVGKGLPGSNTVDCSRCIGVVDYVRELRKVSGFFFFAGNRLQERLSLDRERFLNIPEEERLVAPDPAA